MGASTSTVTIVAQTVFGDKRVHLVKLACSSYGTDGIIITSTLCGLSTLEYALPFFVGAGAVANGPVSAWWDSTNSVIILLKASNSGCDAGTNITTAGYVYVIAIGS
jgi:hypothetical protein